ncbi:MAG: TRAP transporter substrate-binding protein DctP, partial [Candidatus Thiodiazotropha sp.]
MILSKHRTSRLFHAFILTLLMFSLAGACQAKTVLKIATLAPDGSSWMKEMRAAAESIEAQTQGRVSIRFYPGGVMGNDNSVLRKIRMGQLQGGAITGGGLSAINPDTQTLSLPFQFRNLDEVDAVRKVMDQQIIDALNGSGYICFGLSEGGFAYLFSNSPVETTEDKRVFDLMKDFGTSKSTKIDSIFDSLLVP